MLIWTSIHNRTSPDDPYPVYRALRETHPVFYSPQGRFGPSRATTMCSRRSAGPRCFPRAGLSASPRWTTRQRTCEIVILDPPRHDELRALVSRAFTPRRIAALEPVSCHHRRAHRRVHHTRRCDLFRELAAPLPTIVIAELLGVPPATARCSRRSRVAIASSVSPRKAGAAVRWPPSSSPPTSARCSTRSAGGRADDLMSALLAAEIWDGG